MTNNPVELFTKVLPEIFAGAKAHSEGLAKKGDTAAAKRLEEATKAEGALRIVLEGKTRHDIYLTLQNGVLTPGSTKPTVPLLAAVSAPYDAVEIGLEEQADEIEERLPKAKKRLSFMSANKVRALIDRVAGENLGVHVVIKDTPDFDEVRLKVAVGGAEPPEKPSFTVTVNYDTLEELRAGKIKPQSIMSSIQLTGDVSRGMALGMEVIQMMAAREG